MVIRHPHKYTDRLFAFSLLRGAAFQLGLRLHGT